MTETFTDYELVPVRPERAMYGAEYAPGPCPRCGAKTTDEAEMLCAGWRGEECPVLYTPDDGDLIHVPVDRKT